MLTFVVYERVLTVSDWSVWSSCCSVMAAVGKQCCTVQRRIQEIINVARRKSHGQQPNSERLNSWNCSRFRGLTWHIYTVRCWFAMGRYYKSHCQAARSIVFKLKVQKLTWKENIRSNPVTAARHFQAALCKMFCCLMPILWEKFFTFLSHTISATKTNHHMRMEFCE